jgi:hypothetical protein
MEIFFALATFILVYFIIFQALFAQQNALSFADSTFPLNGPESNPQLFASQRRKMEELLGKNESQDGD